MELECPAEIVIERLDPNWDRVSTTYQYVWEICQPDAHWGVYESGIEDSHAQALVKAKEALNRVHSKQGYA